VAAYRQGAYPQAIEAFTQAAKQQASPTLWRNLALSALAAKEFVIAEDAADRLAASGRAEDIAWRDFLRANVAWQQSLGAEIEAHGPVPPAGALARAIAQTQAATEGWQAAAQREGGWREAEENLTLASARLAQLQAERDAAGAAGPEQEKMAPPPGATPPLDNTRRQQLMQQLERLDRQRQQRKEAKPKEPAGEVDW